MNQFITSAQVGISKLRYIVLDEADQMLDLGFQTEIRRMMENYEMPPKGIRQTLMVSATSQPEIQQLAHDFLNNHVSIINVGEVSSVNKDITEFEKHPKLLTVVKEDLDKANAGENVTTKTLVFVEHARVDAYLASRLDYWAPSGHWYTWGSGT